ncbi:multidrug resistance protein A [Sporosarcina sp. NCCP-2716]|uniref:efflux RND transporter periplasmic adaptor subunit n=1 Tax=Sporosarcina sp. NCCP-2716 TaxID=2943679 RepID=UPI0020423208|nr:efflux RND transporter periplasmic adaptor subunit [Sporosarcina sp. NCCP-2716]GKV69321.1 multidrug resistance protein A [Sporosarcina sp. NCCP-2716]
MNMKKMLMLNVVLLIVLVGGGFAGYYFYNKSVTYLSTDNAQVAGQQVRIASPAAGKLTEWKGATGDTFKKGDTVGTMEAVSEQGKMEMPITAPADGTIVQSTAVENTMVGAGTPLAVSYDMTNLWVTANIEETKIDDVKVGQEVDIYVDAYPDLKLTGEVKEIGLATAGTFSLLPSTNASGNYTKETQVIPVRISIDDYAEKLIPGINVTVRIHK